MSGIKTSGLQELLPWMCPVTEKLVLLKDGSLMANYKIAGIDVDHKNEDTIIAARKSLDHACAPLGSGHTAFFRVDRRKVKPESDNSITNPIAKAVNDVHLATLSNGHYYENNHYLSLVSTPLVGLDKFFEKVSLHMENGKSAISSLFRAAKENFSEGNNFQFSKQQLVRDEKKFENILNSLEGSSPHLRLKRLELSDQYSFLHATANPAVPARKVHYPESLMDHVLGENYITIGANKLKFKSPHGEKYVTALGIKELPSFTESGLLDAVLAIDGEVTYCLMYRFLDKDKAKTIISSIKRHYEFTQINLRSILRILFKADDEVDKGRMKLAQEAEEALTRITAENLQFGYANGTILCYGDTSEECDELTRRVARTLNKNGFGCYQEDFNMTASWASSLPGNWKEQNRLHLLSTPNISDIAPIMTVDKGNPHNSWFSQQTQKLQPALTILPTRFNTLTYVNFHVTGGSGHVMVVGPTGAGKSIFLNFLTYQTDRYKPRRYTFDRDRSCRISTILNGGSFIDIGGKYQAATKINPIALLNEKRHFSYVVDWVQLTIEAMGHVCSAEDVKQIKNSVELLSSFDSSQYRLSCLVGLLPPNLQDQLSPWIEGGKEGRFFDHLEDAFNLTDEVCIEMGDLMDNHPKAAALAVDYFFYRIADGLSEGDKRPTYIKVEEGSFFVSHPIFAKRLKDATVTIRKRNGSIWLAIQSLHQLKDAPGFQILQENFKNKIYLPNESATKEIYSDLFNCTPRQVMFIKEGTPNKDYLWINESITRQFTVRFTDQIVALTRSDELAQNTFDYWYDQRDVEPSWRTKYVKAMLTK